MGATLVSRLLGFVRVAVIGAIFGGSGTADVVHAVFMVPNNLRKLLAEGALSSAFVPEISRLLVEDGSNRRAIGLAQRLIGFQLAVTGPVVFLAALFPAVAARILFDFPEAARMALAAELLPWLTGYIVLVGLSATVMGVLNCHDVFVIPALSPPLFSVCVITALALFSRSLGVWSLVIGVLAGGAAQLLFQIPLYLSRGYRLLPSLRFRDETFRRVLRQWFPVLISSSIFAITQQVAIVFASGLADGSASALANALVFWQLPFGVFSASVSKVLFPRMSRAAARGDSTDLSRLIAEGLVFILALLLPAMLGYLVMGDLIISLALERGAFSAGASARAASVLSGYSLGFFSVGAFNLLQRASYALRDFNGPLLASAVVAVIDVVLSLWLKETPLGVVGLALANSVAFSAGALLLWIWRMARRDRTVGALPQSEPHPEQEPEQAPARRTGGSAGAAIRVLLCNIPVVVILVGSRRILNLFDGSPGTLFIGLSVVVLVVVAALAVSYRIATVPFVVDLLARVRTRRSDAERRW